MLRVKKKGYTRKSYTRKGGVRVKSSKVGASSFKIKDRGAKGRTPESQKFFEPKVHSGWKADMAQDPRRRLALRAHKGNKLSTARSLQALSNVQHRVNPDVSRKAASDAQYFYAQHRKAKK